jgi:predicted nucleic acid-binding Zn ribbon protein
MPTYVYKFVDTGETVEIQQSFSDPTLTEAVHPRTGAVMAVKKVFQPVGVTFKGDGFYKTDSRATSKGTSRDKSGGADGGSGSDAGSGNAATTDGGGSAPATPAATGSSSGASSASS